MPYTYLGCVTLDNQLYPTTPTTELPDPSTLNQLQQLVQYLNGCRASLRLTAIQLGLLFHLLPGDSNQNSLKTFKYGR